MTTRLARLCSILGLLDLQTTIAHLLSWTLRRKCKEVKTSNYSSVETPTTIM